MDRYVQSCDVDYTKRGEVRQAVGMQAAEIQAIGTNATIAAAVYTDF